MKRSVSEVSQDDVVSKLQRSFRKFHINGDLWREILKNGKEFHLPEEIWGEIVKSGKEFTTKDFFHILLACGNSDIRNYLVSPEIVGEIHWIGVADWRTMKSSLPPKWMADGAKTMQLNLRGCPNIVYDMDTHTKNIDAFDTRFLILLSKFVNLRTLVLNDENEDGLGHFRFTQVVQLPWDDSDDSDEEEGIMYGDGEIRPFVHESLETLKIRFRLHYVNNDERLRKNYRYDLGCFPNLKNFEICDVDTRLSDTDRNDFRDKKPTLEKRYYFIEQALENFVLTCEFAREPESNCNIRNPLESWQYQFRPKIANIHIKPSYSPNRVATDDWFDGRVVLNVRLDDLFVSCTRLHIQNAQITDRDGVAGYREMYPRCETFICQDCLFWDFSIAFNMRTVKHFIILDKYDQKTLRNRSGSSHPTWKKEWFLDKIHPESKIESITYHDGVFSDEEVDKLTNDVWKLTGRTLTVNKKPNPLFQQQQQEVKKEKGEDRMEIQTHVEQKGFLHYKGDVKVTKSDMEMILDNVDLFEVANELTEYNQ